MRMMFVIALAVGLAASGCRRDRANESPASVSSEPARARVLADAPIANPSSVPAGAEESAQRTVADASAAAPCRQLVLANACVRSEAFEPVERDTWFSSHGASPPTGDGVETCRTITVGPSHEEALHCHRADQLSREASGGQTPVFRVGTTEVIYVVRGRRPVVAFEKLVGFDVFDKEVLEEGPLFALNVDTANAAERIELAEPREGACAEAKRGLAEKLADADQRHGGVEAAWDRFDRELVTRLCNATGRYVWQGGAFVRAM